MMRDVAVIGGGLAGAAAATHLARAGRDVVLVERSDGPHDKVCGEFLSYEAQEELLDLGIDLRALGAVPMDRVMLRSGLGHAEAALGFEALSLSRRVLDEALVARACMAGAEVRRGTRVTRLMREGEGWSVAAQDGARLRARHVMLATGKHDLRGWGRPPGRQADLVGFKMFWRWPDPWPDPRPAMGRVELHLFPGGYAGFQPVDGGRANLCLVVRERVLARLGGRWEALLDHVLRGCPGLAGQLADAVPCAPKPLAVARIPYGLVQRDGGGLWRLGDQAAVIPSFTGEGMSIALHSARLAARHLGEGGDPEVFQRRLASDLYWQVRRSTAMSQALVVPIAQRALARVMAPPLLRRVLRGTRIPDAARRRIRPGPG